MKPIPVVFHLGPLQIHTYGIGLALTFWFAFAYFERRLQKNGFARRLISGPTSWARTMLGQNRPTGAEFILCPPTNRGDELRRRRRMKNESCRRLGRWRRDFWVQHALSVAIFRISCLVLRPKARSAPKTPLAPYQPAGRG